MLVYDNSDVVGRYQRDCYAWKTNLLHIIRVEKKSTDDPRSLSMWFALCISQFSSNELTKPNVPGGIYELLMTFDLQSLCQSREHMGRDGYPGVQSQLMNHEYLNCSAMQQRTSVERTNGAKFQDLNLLSQLPCVFFPFFFCLLLVSCRITSIVACNRPPDKQEGKTANVSWLGWFEKRIS